MVITRALQMATIDDLKEDIKRMNDNISDRLTKIENNITEQVKKLVLEHLETVRTELKGMILALGERVKTLENNPVSQQSVDDRSCNFVIYGMEESADENVSEKVNNLISAQLKLRDARVIEATRKNKYNGNTCGVIVAKCSDTGVKSKIMEAKSLLRNSEHHGHISISHDKPKWLRQHEANMRLIVKTLGTNRLHIRGNRVCTSDDQQTWNNPGNRGQGNRGRGEPRGGRGQGRGRGVARGQPRGQDRNHRV